MGDPDHGGSVLADGEVTGLLGGSGTGAVGSAADERAWVENHEHEHREGQVRLVRG